MEELIKQAFLHVDVIGPHVHEGHYDLVGPDGEIILPQIWETMIQPDWAITMHMWPMPEPPPPPPEPPREVMPVPMPMPMEFHPMPPPPRRKEPKRDKSRKRDSHHAVQVPMFAPAGAPPPPPPPPPPPVGVQIMNDGGMPPIFVGPGPESHAPSRKKKEVAPSPFMRWAAGGASRSQSLKGVKKPKASLSRS
jgi:hypothetical protein